MSSQEQPLSVDVLLTRTFDEFAERYGLTPGSQTSYMLASIEFRKYLQFRTEQHKLPISFRDSHREEARREILSFGVFQGLYEEVERRVQRTVVSTDEELNKFVRGFLFEALETVLERDSEALNESTTDT